MCMVCNPGLFSFLKEGAQTRRQFFRTGAALASATVLSGEVGAQPSAPAAPADAAADTIFHGGSIITVNEAQPQVEAVAVRGGRIVAMGSRASLDAWQGPGTQMVALGDQALLPGFVDPHMHCAFAMLDGWLDLGPFVNASLGEAKAKLVAALAKARAGDWVMGQLYDPTITAGEWDVSVQALDALAPDTPVFILEANGHIGHVNSAAFKAAKISKDTPNPPHGLFVRDARGELTGEVQESAAIGRFAVVAPHISGPEYLANVGRLFNMAASKGCTTLHDCGIGSFDAQGDWMVMKAAMANNPPVRMSAFLVSTAMPTWQKLGLKPDHRSEVLRINGIKAWADGTNQGGSGFQREPYLQAAWKNGTPNYSQAELNAAVQAAHDGGWQVGIHANGDAGIDMALKAYEAAQQRNPQSDRRHRIEHSTVCHPEQLDAMKRLGVSPSFLIGHVYYYGAVFRDQIFGPARANLIDPCKTALDKGLRISLHSDYNCQPIAPLRYVHNAVTRQIRNTTQQLNPAEAITLTQALRAVTLDAAWQCHMDDLVGSIEVGKCADFVVLGRNPYTVPPMEILNIPVRETWLGGVRRHAA